MKRKKVISQISEAESTEEQLEVRNRHIASGHKMTKMKETLLHNLPIFDAFVEGSYAVSDEIERLIDPTSIYILDYFISWGNECIVCGGYFERLLKEIGITDPEHFEFTDEQKDLIAFGEALARDPNHVPDEVYEALQARYDEETMVALVTHGVFMLANNYFNNIVGVAGGAL
ncbi:MAG: hypothetical protein K6G57_06235 [Lachnospiraceae bacterium]|nr:hypothetical protein [Lachnospiraceae bacterium]